MAATAHKQMILDTRATDVFLTASIDGAPANWLAPSLLAAGIDLDELRTTLPGKIVSAHDNKKRWKDIYTAGHGVGNIDDIPAAAELLNDAVAAHSSRFQIVGADEKKSLAADRIRIHRNDRNSRGYSGVNSGAEHRDIRNRNEDAAGFRRRGYTPEAIREFCARVGVARNLSVVDVALLEHTLREDLNPRSPRVLCVLKPLKITLENWPAGEVALISPAGEMWSVVIESPKMPSTRAPEMSLILPICMRMPSK